MKIYITATFKGSDNKAEIEKLCSLVQQSGFEDFCFIRDVENYQKVFDDTHELMQRAKEEIASCDALLLDYNGPGHGRIIELGIAYALGKKIILITHKGTFVKDTIRGVADGLIEYDNLKDIVNPMSQLLSDWE